MIFLWYCYGFFILQRCPRLVSGLTFSLFAREKAINTITKTKLSIHKKWQRDSPLIFLPKSRLYQDFTDGEIENFSDESSNIEYVGDFADFDFVVGDDAAASDGATEDSIDVEAPGLDSPSPSSVLQRRFKKLAHNEQVDRQQISDNWKEGYWGAWGCSLDPCTGDNAEKTIVTCVRCMPSLPGNDGSDDSALLIVGRSDGSICWLQMKTILSPSASSSRSISPSDIDPKNKVENRSITTYFENKLGAKETDDGGMIIENALQRQENDSDDSDDNYVTDDDFSKDSSLDQSSPSLPFDILAQIQTAASSTPADSGASAAIVDILPLPSVNMVWTVSHGAPNSIQGWKLVPHSETDFLLPSTSLQSSKFDIKTIHTSPIVAMKAIPKSNNDKESHESFVVSVSNNGQVVVWEVTATDNKSSPSIRIRLDANLLQEQQNKEYDENDSVLSIAVDEEYLYLGSRMGRIFIFSWSTITEDFKSADTGSIRSLPLVNSFLAFTSRNPGVSTLFAAGSSTSGASNIDSSNSNKSNRPRAKELIAGNMSGGLKQWELIPVGEGRLENWPRMSSQKLTGGKLHVYETRDYSLEDPLKEGHDSFSPAIKELLCIQQVLLAATDHDLTFWDSTSGKMLYDMRGLDFTLATVVGSGSSNGNGQQHRPSLIVENDSFLVTNGMENFVCVHDFTMDRVTEGNDQDFLDRDDAVNPDDDIDNGSGVGSG